MWPAESLPELQPAFQDLGRLIVQTGLLLAAHLDRRAASSLPAGDAGSILHGTYGTAPAAALHQAWL